jgi:hypothetical protein
MVGIATSILPPGLACAADKVANAILKTDAQKQYEKSKGKK